MSPQIKLLLKNLKYPINHGYQLRTKPKSNLNIIIHSTNGVKGSQFASEEAFLLNTDQVSAHFLIGKNGNITQFLPVTTHMAWHAGVVTNDKYSNDNTIGIESHYTPGEDTNMPKLYQALTDLVHYLQETYTISEIVTHRSVASPIGRKVDPSFWSDAQFEQWKADLMTQNIPMLTGAWVSTFYLTRSLTRHAPHLNSAQSNAIVSAYNTFGEISSIGNKMPIAQAIHETGWFTSDRFLQNNNPAGLGANDTGAVGGVFDNISHGVMCHFAHLLCYAKKPSELSGLQLQLSMLSPRRNDLALSYGLGVAQNNWYNLNQRWNSPKGTVSGYTDSILQIGQLLETGN